MTRQVRNKMGQEMHLYNKALRKQKRDRTSWSIIYKRKSSFEKMSLLEKMIDFIQIMLQYRLWIFVCIVMWWIFIWS